MSLRTVLGGVGAAVGFVVGGPGGARWGFMIGSTLGSIIDPGTIQGPRIGEIANQTAQEGGPRPIVIGISPPMPGNVIAQGAARVVKKKKGGKGTPKVKTETVFRTYAIGVCEGPIGGFRRVWRNNVLVYDVTGLSALTADDNTAFLEQARFFLGTYDQLPSADLEVEFGVGTTPAFRGTAYMVIKDEDLTELRGAIPQWTFQVTNNIPETILSNDALFPWANSSSDPRNEKNTHEYRYWFAFGGRVGQAPEDSGPGSWRTTLAQAEADGNAKTDPLNQYVHRLGWSRLDPPDGVAYGGAGNWMSPVVSVDADEREILVFSYNYNLPDSFTGVVPDPDTGAYICGSLPNFTPAVISADNKNNWWTGLTVSALAANFAGTHRLTPAPAVAFDWEQGENNCNNYTGLPGVLGTSDYHVQMRRVPGKPEGEWSLVAGSYNVLAVYGTDLAGASPHAVDKVVQYPLNPCLEVGDDNDTEEFWTAAYNAAVLAGQIPGGLTYGVDYPVEIDHAWQGSSVNVDGKITVAATVERICNRAGVPSTLLDLTGLAGLDTYGITLTNQYAAVEGIRSLGQVKFFDLVPSDGLIRFVQRGGDHVAEILEGDFVDGDEESLTDERDDSISVPRVLNMNYYDIAGGMVTDKQTSERAGDRRSIGEASLQSTVIMDADEAARATVVNHKVLAENARGAIKFSLSDRFIGLLQGDNIIAPIGGVNRRLRIERADTQDGKQAYELCYDRQSAYVSNVEGIPAAPQTPPPSSLVGPTLIIPLDIPLLRDSDDAVGLAYYVAVAGLAEAWSGALVELSRDGGANYIDSQEASAQSVIGSLLESLGDHPSEIPDRTHTIRVHIETPDSELEETDLAGMMNRENLAAIGTPETGFELINFANAEQGTDGYWTLSLFLRGRKGTEPREHQPGEKFVLLERSQLGLIPAELGDIGNTLTFRATSFGTPDTTGTVVNMLFTGQMQRERRPGYLTAHREADELAISWQGVGRLGGGASATHGARFAGYRVKIEDGVHDAIVVDTDDQALTADIAGVLEPYKVSVTQLNDLTGEGPAAFWPEQEPIPALSQAYLWALGKTHPFEIGGTWVNRIYFLDGSPQFYIDVRFSRNTGLDYSLHMFPLDATSVADRLNAQALADQMWGLVRDPDDPDILYWTDGLIATKQKILHYSEDPKLAQQSYGLADMIFSVGELFVAHLVDAATNYIDVLERGFLSLGRQLALGSRVPFRFIHDPDESDPDAVWIADNVNGTHNGQLHRVDRDTGMVDVTINTRRFPLGGMIRDGHIYVYCKNNDVGHAPPAGYGVFKYRISDGAELGYWINPDDLEEYIGQESNAVVVHAPYLAVAWGPGHKVFDTSVEAYIAEPP